MHQAIEFVPGDHSTFFFGAGGWKTKDRSMFGGLTNEETAEVLDVSESTVKREWRMARAWLTTKLT